MGASSYIEDSRQSKRVSKGLVVAVVALPLLLLNVIAYFLGLYSNTACDVGSTCGPSFNPAVLLGTFVVTLAYLAIAYAGSTRASLAFTGATKADGTYSEARSLLENVSIAAGIPTPTLYIVQDPAPNAFAVGTNPKNSAVAVTTGLLELMDRRGVPLEETFLQLNEFLGRGILDEEPAGAQSAQGEWIPAPEEHQY